MKIYSTEENSFVWNRPLYTRKAKSCLTVAFPAGLSINLKSSLITPVPCIICRAKTSTIPQLKRCVTFACLMPLWQECVITSDLPRNYQLLRRSLRGPGLGLVETMFKYDGMICLYKGFFIQQAGYSTTLCHLSIFVDHGLSDLCK